MSSPEFDRIKLAVQERLGASMPDADDGEAFELVLDDRQLVQVAFDPEGERISIVAPVALPSRPLSAEAKRYLLTRNVPIAGTAGALVRTTPGGRRIELVNVLPVGALGPAQVAGMAANQGAEAARLAGWLADNSSRDSDA